MRKVINLLKLQIPGIQKRMLRSQYSWKKYHTFRFQEQLPEQGILVRKRRSLHKNQR